MEKEILNIKYKILDDPAYKTNSVPEMSEEELQVIFSNQLFVDIKCVLEINHHIFKKMFWQGNMINSICFVCAFMMS